MKALVAFSASLVITLSVATPIAAACSSAVFYHPTMWIAGICYPETGFCEGESVTDEVSASFNLQWNSYADGSMLYRLKATNQYGQLVSCIRYCTCEGGTCQAQSGFQNNHLPCPAQ